MDFSKEVYFPKEMHPESKLEQSFLFTCTMVSLFIEWNIMLIGLSVRHLLGVVVFEFYIIIFFLMKIQNY